VVSNNATFDRYKTRAIFNIDMITRKAKYKDIPAINALIPGVEANYLVNGKDIAIVACDKETVVGFIWCGVLASGTLGLVDFFFVSDKWRNKKVGQKLTKQLAKVCKLKKIKEVRAHIRHDAFHDASAMNCLKAGLKADKVLSTGIYGSVEDCAKVLGV